MLCIWLKASKRPADMMMAYRVYLFIFDPRAGFRLLLVVGIILALVKPVSAQKNWDTVAATPTGTTLELNKHGTVRLIGIMADEQVDLSHWLAPGDRVEVRYISKTPNRHKEHAAHIYLRDGRWLQGALVSEGKARVFPEPFYPGSVRELYLLESLAERKRKGLWAENIFNTEPANPPTTEVNRYGVIDGVVLDVADVKDNIYLNFGENWRNDFTVRIQKPNIKLFRVQALDPFALVGEKIRVRGWVIERNGPMIEIDHPIQLQLLN